VPWVFVGGCYFFLVLLGFVGGVRVLVLVGALWMFQVLCVFVGIVAVFGLYSWVLGL